MSFLDDQNMSRLCEKFILEYCRKNCPLLKASSHQIKWAMDNGFGTLLPTMQTDIALSRGNQAVIALAHRRLTVLYTMIRDCSLCNSPEQA